MEVTGRIIEVLPLKSGTSARGEWKIQEYVIEYALDQQFPKKMCFNVWGENIDKFNIQKGQELTVSVDIDCREYQGRWFNDIRAWRVVPQTNTVPPVQPPTPDFGQGLGAAPTYSAPASNPVASSPEDAASDLPF
ncbi:MAG: DUF3127 domain-containing protein [Paludibacteraceae bacterium]|nr:DUF3127 domain-containing protein [Paludibacteraceae bacterium]